MQEFFIKQFIEIIVASLLTLLIVFYIHVAGLDVPGDTVWALWMLLLLTTDAESYCK